MIYKPSKFLKTIAMYFGAALFCMVGLSTHAFAQEIYQENSENLQIELRDLEEIYQNSEENIQAASAKLDKLLAVGYVEKSTRIDLQDIASLVGTEYAIIEDLGTRIKEIIKRLGGGVKPLKIIVRRGSKQAKPLTVTAKGGDFLYFTAKAWQLSEMTLNWAIQKPDGQVSESLHKKETVKLNEDNQYSFGIDTTGMEEGVYQVLLEYYLTSDPDTKYNSKAKFEISNLASEVKILRLVVDNEKSGDEHKTVLEAESSAYLFAYYEVPPDVSALTIRYRLRDWTDRKTIFEKTGRRRIKPGDDVQRVGVFLDVDEVPLISGHEYRFDIRMTDDLRGAKPGKKYETQSKNIFFFYGNEPKRVKIDKLAVGSSEDSKEYLNDVPKQEGPIYLNLWYKATGGVSSVKVDVKLVKRSDKSIVYEYSVTRDIDKNKPIEKLSLPVEIEKFEIDVRYAVEVGITSEGLEIESKTHRFIYAKLPPVDMSKHVHVSGVIQTPGFPDAVINPNGKNYYRKGATLVFKVPAQSPPGLKGKLIWGCKYGCKRKIIKLGEGNADWGYSFTTDHKMGFGELQLTFDRSILYSPTFVRQTPFSIRMTNGQTKEQKSKFYPWDIESTRLQIRSNGHAVNANVSVEVSLSNGKMIATQTNTMSLPADKFVDWNLKLDPALFKFDLGAVFPKINKYSFSNNFNYKIKVTDGNGNIGKRTEYRSISLYRLGDENVKKDSNSDSLLAYTILPPAGMVGPYKTSLYGTAPYYMDGLKMYHDREILDDWVLEVGTKKISEDNEKIRYKKTFPLLITVEDSTGKQAVVFWQKFSFTASIFKMQESDQQ